MMSRYTIILAAGQGTRMKSKLAKVLHPVCGRPMVDHVLTQVEQINPDKVVTIVGHGAGEVEAVLGKRTEYVLQAEQKGSGDAVLRGEPVLGDLDGMTLVVSGDTPLLTAKTFEQLFEYHKEKGAKATVLTAVADDPTGYGRIIRNDLGVVEKIVEQKDASKEEAAINEINTGVYCFDNKTLFAALHEVGNDNAQGEYYLTDVIGILKQKGEIVSAFKMKDFEESMGVNTRGALANATRVMQRRINAEHMANGVTLIDPTTTRIDVGVKIGADTTIEAGVLLKGQTEIGEDCYVGSHSELRDAKIGADVTITSSTIEKSVMHAHSNIGPMSHLRPNSEIGEYVHIGNFCEVKNAQIGAYTKVGHLTYVGDATLGQHINVGCGVVFVNYDGLDKHHTDVGDWAFVGSNANIVAPVKVADHAFIAAGSTITADVDFHDMAIARARQVNKPNYWDKLPHEPEN
ncbi:bifunctional N-acetylglucosamine-1-phosphate uridyltransferase/glucosamine-1-phosphate acetyltransferase [Loigolactobacillus backii]|uniref:bifunctional UDP-N-acetylglucosamine diphosphorylase/glucosamine-1-phosphate N-acetyltransferase GlmU n=1 Tax=Loigolactobacillus backii TaxID=375175 RepID=UPI0007F06CCF|nr:bifunctional UDP-N-acetylglucosamine diphosphorylase/glucosamine-1-phosphate N-acetyltransferase GlmU [Loigolactobacillus backii]ANK60256.1 bifunctional N-acetylglucosamine-1-phosphate uridyltransferase/glucosamine-1-phosphate acetyltransferase [Loigolactobacillus backii]ANK65138.1 bifunctional N-acetylglucosamine-1-phosphate uridyltransferase/glucosamine-1-phosphate acetyltransferase [Loigolactobacillus backii]OLF70177.1 glucosamine-1-phosphate N-acetyltransferase [Loigolactobacillus backii]